AALHQRTRALGQRRQRIGRDVMGLGEVLAGQPVQEAAGDGFARGEGDGVHQDVEAVAPVPAELFVHRRDLGVVGDVERERRSAAELGGRFLHPRLQLFILVGEGQFGTFAVHGLGNAVGDGTLAGDAGDQCTLALQETHGRLAVWTGRYSATAVAVSVAGA